MAENEDKGDGSVAHIDHSSEAEDMDRSVHGSEKWLNWRVAMNLLVVGLALGLFGYDNAFASPLISLPLFVLKYQGLGPGGVPVFTAGNLDLIITVPLVGAALGAFAAIPLQNRFGRKKSLLVAYASCSIPGSILQLFAPNIGALVFGRFWNGVGVSILTNVAPIYLSELVPARYRARAIGFTIAGSGAVSVIAAVTVWAAEKINDSRQYKIPLAVQAAAPLSLFLLSLLLTESPIWLLSKDRPQEARKNLMSIRAANARLVDAELSLALIGLRTVENNREAVGPLEIFRSGHMERTMVAGALLCLGQVGGQILVGTYSTVILVESGVADPFKITILIFLLSFIGTIIGPILLDKVGRRPVALVGFIFLFAIDVVGGALACAGLKTHSEKLGLAALCIIFGFVNAVCFQSLALLAPTEIPTARLREPTVAWSVFWSYTTAIITTFAVPQLTSADAGNLGAKAFLVFAGCMLVTNIWAYFYLPETANRTLAEIDELYASGLPKRKWKGYKTIAVSNAAAEVMERKFEGVDE